MDATDLTPATELLGRELPDVRFSDDRYLHWLYRENPLGRGYEGDVDDEGVRVAHYGLIPQIYRDPSGPVPCVFSLNAVVRSGTQRKGYFTKVGAELYERAAADERRFAVGVCNAKSIGAVTKYMGWKNVGALPVKVGVAAGRTARDVEHYVADEQFLGSADFERVVRDYTTAPVSGWTNDWSGPQLAWRLARPHATYQVHVAPDLALVTTRTVERGVPATVVMKVFPHRDAAPGLHAGPIVRAACRKLRTPISVYAGFNAAVRITGVQPPRRLLPSPLYLILKSLHPSIDQSALTLATFEFLDQDAY
jgi:hypothetical protein